VFPLPARAALITYAATTRTVTADGLLPLLDAHETEVRAAVLRESADGFDRHAEKLLSGIGDKAVFVAKALRDQAAVWREAAEALRRMAVVAPQPETQAAGPELDEPEPLADDTRDCVACGCPMRSHIRDGADLCCAFCGCSDPAAVVAQPDEEA
jgi:hypothetical protein